VFRNVDDFLILCTTEVDETADGCLNTTLRHFQTNRMGLTFTYELPADMSIRFLDLVLEFQKEHDYVCWSYNPRSKKGLLSYSSAHSKIVKRGIASSCLHAPLTKSCQHKVPLSFDNQVARLGSAGYPKSLIPSVCERLLQRIKRGGGVERRDKVDKTPFTVPFYHAISHNLKVQAARFGDRVVFKNDFRLSRLTPFTRGRKGYGKNHRNPAIECQEGVVYNIPLACGFSYIGQTGRCVNERLMEHKRCVLLHSPNSEIVKYLELCNNCQPDWTATTVISRERDQFKRVVKETRSIGSAGNCVSVPSIVIDKR
ncbi:unnamed protein product, partial [Ixodes hexagonus]